VVAIPDQADSELNCLVDKSDGKTYSCDFRDWGSFDEFGRDGMRVVENTPSQGKKALLYRWSVRCWRRDRHTPRMAKLSHF
jgi:hypothetical protein